MSASMMLRGGLSNTTLQYAGVSSMTRRCGADSVMTHTPGCELPLRHRRRRMYAPRSSLRLFSSTFTELRARRCNELRVGVGVTGEPPAAVRGLGEQHPDPLLHRRVVGRRSNDPRQLGDHRELLLAVEAPGIREHL